MSSLEIFTPIKMKLYVQNTAQNYPLLASMLAFTQLFSKMLEQAK